MTTAQKIQTKIAAAIAQEKAILARCNAIIRQLDADAIAAARSSVFSRLLSAPIGYSPTWGTDGDWEPLGDQTENRGFMRRKHQSQAL